MVPSVLDPSLVACCREWTSWELCDLLGDLLSEPEHKAVSVSVINAWIARSWPWSIRVDREHAKVVLANRPMLLRRLDLVPTLLDGDVGLREGISSLRCLHPQQLVELLGELAGAGVFKEEAVRKGVQKLVQTKDQELSLLQETLSKVAGETITMNRIFSYVHASALELNRSQRSYFLSGEQGDFPLDLYCYSKDNGLFLKYSDKVLDLPEFSRTPQYYSIEGQDERAEFCFRCADANRFSDVALFENSKEWEDYYNASVRCSRYGVETLKDCFGVTQSHAVALHSGIALFRARSMLHYLQLMRENDSISGVRTTISTVTARRAGSVLRISWKLEHCLTVGASTHEIQVFTVPDDVVEVRDELELCPHYQPLDLMRLRLCPSKECTICRDKSNSWFCFMCKKAFCGKSVNKHMTKHSEETGHFVCISMNDKTVWCNKCLMWV